MTDYLKDPEEENAKDIQCVWEFCQRNLSLAAQNRVRERVVNQDMSLDKAVQREGIMFCRTKADLSGAKALFVAKVLEVEEKSTYPTLNGATPEPAESAIDAVTDEIKEQIKEHGFIPRQKNRI